MTQAIKKKRTLTNIDFSKDNSHIALVSEDQGGPANGADYALVIKGACSRSSEFVEKATKIQVEMTIEEYLERFYNIWGSDALVLAKIFGFDVESDEDDWDYDKWIEERVASVTVLKALKNSTNKAETLATLDDEATLAFLKDQETFEKSLKEFESSQMLDDKAAKPATKVGPTGSKTIKKGKTVETIEKSKYDVIEKALADQKVELQKALDLLKAAEAEKQATILKSKTDALSAVIKDTAQVATVMKAAAALEKQEDFDALVEVFKSLQIAVEKTALFTETGATVEVEEKPATSKLKEFLKARNEAAKAAK